MSSSTIITILEVWRKIENQTPPIDACLREEHYCHFHPEPTLNDVAFGFFHDGLPNKKDKMNKINEMCSDMHEISSRSN